MDPTECRSSAQWGGGNGSVCFAPFAACALCCCGAVSRHIHVC